MPEIDRTTTTVECESFCEIIFNCILWQFIEIANSYQGNILELVLSSCVFNDEDVRDILISFDPTKAKGPCVICPYVLKSCAIALYYPLTKHFNFCVSSATIYNYIN